MDYLASYDLENIDACVEAAGAVAAMHRELGLPATFFIVGRCLEEHGEELKRILDHELFDLQTHTYSHRVFRRMPGADTTVDTDARREVFEGARLVSETFGRPCVGLRTGCGYDGGMRELPRVLEACAEAGLSYVSSDLRGPGDTLPSPLKGPYTYAEQGYPALWELPVHGWHENVLKGYSPRVGMVVYPPLADWHLPPATPRTPQDHATHHLLWVDKAREAQLPFVSLAFHPWSIFKYDNDLRAERLIFEGLAERGVAVTTCTAAYEKLAGVPTGGGV